MKTFPNEIKALVFYVIVRLKQFFGTENIIKLAVFIFNLLAHFTLALFLADRTTETRMGYDTVLVLVVILD